MKRCLSVLGLILFAATLALAAPSEARLIPARATHQRAQRHHAHKAARHHHAKRAHHRSI